MRMFEYVKTAPNEKLKLAALAAIVPVFADETAMMKRGSQDEEQKSAAHGK